MPNTAVALLLMGAAGALLHREPVGRVRRTLSLLAAIVVLVIGVGTLAEYALDVTSGLNQLFVRIGAGPYPGRPSPPTALALTFLAGALLLFDSRPTARARPSEWLILCAGLIGLAALLGQLLGVGPLYRLSRASVVGVAVPTALSLLLTSAGLLLERPHAGVMRVATSPGPGGLMLRRLVPAAVLAPAVLGIIVTRILADLGVEDLPLVSATLAALMTVAGLFLLTVTAVPLDRAHEALELSRARTMELIEHASDGVFLADLDGALHRRQRRRLPHARLRPRGDRRQDHHGSRSRPRTSSGSRSPGSNSTKVVPTSPSGRSAARTGRTCPWR